MPCHGGVDGSRTGSVGRAGDHRDREHVDVVVESAHSLLAPLGWDGGLSGGETAGKGGREGGRRVARAKVASQVARKTSLVGAWLEGRSNHENSRAAGPRPYLKLVALRSLCRFRVSRRGLFIVSLPSLYLLCGFCAALSEIFIANAPPAFRPCRTEQGSGFPRYRAQPSFFLCRVSVVTKRIIARPERNERRMNCSRRRRRRRRNHDDAHFPRRFRP